MFSPRRRGWSDLGASAGQHARVLPAQAGVVRRSSSASSGVGSSPRAGGGGPAPTVKLRVTSAFSPRRRGWSEPGVRAAYDQMVLPAQAGVVRMTAMAGPGGWRSPRAGGGGPPRRSPAPRQHLFSPRRRGWSDFADVLDFLHVVLPAQAGVVRPSLHPRRPSPRSPRAGGGGPTLPTSWIFCTSFSPRRRGWSVPHYTHVAPALVLPAQAGVVRPSLHPRRPSPRSPRAGGGGPFDVPPGGAGASFSPRRRGWSALALRLAELVVVLPAQAGVVRPGKAAIAARLGSPRAGGGGPANGIVSALGEMFLCVPVRLRRLI
ncbi:hypothetical protein SAMN05421505_111110 [Sinosporangium album]|uniref:Uncharacterized protein n=1 Tax=Sinosporangium album TaxID=504805 RepID=A0A1G7ZNC4_9ACTN|nr:hypothetical protein SAMN05421505_111110 [Sinosporangium album]